MVENSKIRNLQALEVRFIAGVLRDAEKLYWPQGQLEKRKLSINMVMTGRIAEAWEEESNLYGLTESDDEKTIHSSKSMAGTKLILDSSYGVQGKQVKRQLIFFFNQRVGTVWTRDFESFRPNSNF